jgi:hypothetical protein
MRWFAVPGMRLRSGGRRMARVGIGWLARSRRRRWLVPGVGVSRRRRHGMPGMRVSRSSRRPVPRVLVRRIRRSIVTRMRRRRGTRRFSAARGRTGLRPFRRTAGDQHRGQQQ